MKEFKSNFTIGRDKQCNQIKETGSNWTFFINKIQQQCWFTARNNKYITRNEVSTAMKFVIGGGCRVISKVSVIYEEVNHKVITINSGLLLYTNYLCAVG